MGDLAVLDVAADLLDLEPAEMPDGEGRFLDRPVDCLADTLLGRADKFDDLLYMLRHLRFSL